MAYSAKRYKNSNTTKMGKGRHPREKTGQSRNVGNPGKTTRATDNRGRPVTIRRRAHKGV